MNDLEKSLAHLLGREEISLETETEVLAEELEKKACLLDEIRSTLALNPEDGNDMLILALKNLQEKVSADGKIREELESVQQNLADMQAKDAERALNELLDQGVRDGKITPATREWWAKLSLEQVEEHLPSAPVIVPQGTAGLKVKSGKNLSCLTEEDRAACRKLGLSEEKFLEHRKKYS